MRLNLLVLLLNFLNTFSLSLNSTYMSNKNIMPFELNRIKDVTITQSVCDENYTYIYDALDNITALYHTTFYFQQGLNIKSFIIKISNVKEKINIVNDNRTPGMLLYFGCMNSVGCRTSGDSTHRSEVVLNGSPLTIFSENDENIIVLLYKTTYLFIDGIVPQTLTLQFKEPALIRNMNEYLYAFTGTVNSTTIIDGSGLQIVVLCYQNHYGRYAFSKTAFSKENCECIPLDYSQKILKSTVFNYPDCVYNSSMFNLNLSNYMSWNLDIYEWYTIYSNNPMMWITGSNNQVLELEKFDMKSSFSIFLNTKINNLTISRLNVGGWFDSNVEIKQVNLKPEFKNKILFVVHNGLLISEQLESCGERVFTKDCDIDMCVCDYRTTSSSTEFTFLNQNANNCLDNTNSIQLKLNINNYTYLPRFERDIWESLIYSNGGSIIANPNFISTQVEFSFCGVNLKITIETTIKCEILNVYLNTRYIIKNHGVLIIGKIIYRNVINRLNTNGTILVLKGGNVRPFNNKITLSVDQQISTMFFCNEVLSSIVEIDLLLFENPKGISYGSKLYRICFGHNPLSTEIICELDQSDFSLFSSHKNVLYCPLNDNLVTQLIQTKMFIYNYQCNGMFVQQKEIVQMTSFIKGESNFDDPIDNILYIDDTWLYSNTITIRGNKNKLLLGNKMGFELPKYDVQLNKIYVKSNFSSLCNSFFISETGIKECILCKPFSILQNKSCLLFDVNCITDGNIRTRYCETCKSSYQACKEKCILCSTFCLRCIDDQCILCQEVYELKNGICVEVAKEFAYYKSRIWKCSKHYSNENQTCLPCKEGCVFCRNSVCIICEPNRVFDVNGECVMPIGILLTNMKKAIICLPSYFLDNNKCNLCSDFHGNLCKFCTKDNCIFCEGGII
ncbi:hypothetical protein EIN_510300, partial [Entamoeba invadens IP1]